MNLTILQQECRLQRSFIEFKIVINVVNLILYRTECNLF